MKKLVFYLLLISNSVYAQISDFKYFSENCLRIDYLRTGNYSTDSLHDFVFIREPLWSGYNNPSDESNDYGYFKVEMFDSITSQKVAKFNYSSLFQEYKFTPKGKNIASTFEETVRLPFPIITTKIVFYQRNFNTNNWDIQTNFFFNPKLNKIKLVTQQNIATKVLYKSGKPEKSLDIVFVGDGYTKDEKEKFFLDAEKMSGYLKSCYPFSENLNKLNLYAVFAGSKETGISDEIPGKLINTAIGLNFNTLESERYLMTLQHHKLRDIVSSVPYDCIIILANSSHYGGGGIYNFYSTCSVDNEYSDFLLVHEFGHSFAGLADEYYDSEVSVEQYFNLTVEPWEPNITTLVDFSSKWKNLVNQNTPIPTPQIKKYSEQVGVFEGGGYSPKGIYRPKINCTMKSVVYNNFCPVCSGAIQKSIDLYSH